MTKNFSSILTLLLLALVGALAGYGLYQRTQQPAVVDMRPPVVDASLGVLRPDFQLSDMEGKLRSMGEWDGKVILLNFWATWCPPCREEIPAFIKLQEQYGPRGFQVVGIAIDQLESVIDYSDGIGINYPVLVSETEATLISRDYGNRIGALPYSVFIDREGKIRAIRKGEVKARDAEAVIKALL